MVLVVSVVSLVSVVSFRPFRFVVSGFSTCPATQDESATLHMLNSPEFAYTCSCSHRPPRRAVSEINL